MVVSIRNEFNRLLDIKYDLERKLHIVSCVEKVHYTSTLIYIDSKIEAMIDEHDLSTLTELT